MSKKFELQENDVSGETTLDVISDADKFNQWMFDTIRPHTSGRILEIGSGIGNISDLFLKDNAEIMLSDIRTGYCATLEKRFQDAPSLQGVLLMDLTDDDFDTKFADHVGTYDSIFALNVVEHIFDDDLALKNSKKLLKDGGKLVILVPSYQALFNGFDTELEHYRRYTKNSLTKVFKKSDYEIMHAQYFNFIGIFGWFFTGSILRKKTIPEGQMRLYNTLVPIFKVIDKLIFNSAGLSTIVVGKK